MASTRSDRRLHQPVPPGLGRLLPLRELNGVLTLAEVDPSPVAAMYDLNMMVNTGGAERTITEWTVLAQAAGFALTASLDIGWVGAFSKLPSVSYFRLKKSA